MKITDDEREAAWELQYLVTDILRERERSRSLSGHLHRMVPQGSYAGTVCGACESSH